MEFAGLGDAIRIRSEQAGSAEDCAAIRLINQAAFGGREEADLIDGLHRDGHALLSLVAEFEGGIAGHIMFSRMWIRTSSALLNAVALAPLAVVPRHQRRGIGSLLIRRGLELLRESAESIVIVVGHPGYYPKFGFSQGRANSLEGPFPREAFMALELCDGALDGIIGAVVYAPAFGI